MFSGGSVSCLQKKNKDFNPGQHMPIFFSDRRKNMNATTGLAADLRMSGMVIKSTKDMKWSDEAGH